ncbi:unnamed protein product [Dibothriocephalus latus]|uniref:Uncharacterized protein n=1 Tax=Dibothriocephalus latus TaxID=60516 RepID=A0A3P6TKC8_DIBLA|nr:unnamed protein product [Dibothriocephalus latus]
MGVSSLGQPSFTFLLPDPSPAVTRYTTSDDHSATVDANNGGCASVLPVCCNPAVYESALEALSNSPDESKLLYWWCTQARGLIDHAPNVCPARPAAWLCDVSDLELVRRFIFGSACSVPSTSAGPSVELALFHNAFRGFYRDSLSALLSFSEKFLHSTEDDLALDLCNRLLQTLLPLTFNEESRIQLLAGVHSAALTRDFSPLEVSFVFYLILSLFLHLPLLLEEFTSKLYSPAQVVSAVYT